MSDNTEKKMSFSDACRELQISESELEKLVADGEISSVKEGDTFFFMAGAIQAYKKSSTTQPTIIMPQEELDLLDDVDDINIDDLGLEMDEAGTASAAGGDDLDLSDLSLDDLGAPETETSAVTEAASLDGDEASTGEGSHDTVLNLDGLIDDEEGSEATTPVPGLDLGGLDNADDITLDGTAREDDTILDTDVFDNELADESAMDMIETESGGPADPSTLLRSGGARVMQMKRVKGTPAMTCLLLLTGVLLFIPLAVLVNIYFFDRFHPPSEPSQQQWIQDAASVMRPALESIADAIGAIFNN